MKYNDRANYSIHHGALTNSKRTSCFVKGIYPTHIKKGRGCQLIDEENKTYIDFICALGSNLFGYCNPFIAGSVFNQVNNYGSNFSLGSTLEVEAAELLLGKVHFTSKLRFLKTGTEACLASLKIARAHTGRLKVLSEGYHGYSDEFVSLTPPGLGIPPQNYIDKLLSFDQINNDVAAVIVEPVIVDNSPTRMQWLRDLSDKCKKEGTLLIFDEIITGMRYLDFTVSHHHGVQPDILLLGKAIGGGLPLSAVLTRKGIGEDKEWFVSSTFAGDTLALSAFIRSMQLLTTPEYSIQDLWDRCSRFTNEFNSLCPEIITIEGYGTRGVLKGSDLNKAYFMQEMCIAGILFGPTVFFCFPHLEYLEMVLNTARDVISKIKHGNVTLLGEMPVSPFAQKMRE